jgi:hypothetical protein
LTYRKYKGIIIKISSKFKRGIFMKKIVIGLFAVLLCFSVLLAGCKGKSDTPSRESAIALKDGYKIGFSNGITEILGGISLLAILKRWRRNIKPLARYLSIP